MHGGLGWCSASWEKKRSWKEGELTVAYSGFRGKGILPVHVTLAGHLSILQNFVDHWQGEIVTPCQLIHCLINLCSLAILNYWPVFLQNIKGLLNHVEWY